MQQLTLQLSDKLPKAKVVDIGVDVTIVGELVTPSVLISKHALCKILGAKGEESSAVEELTAVANSIHEYIQEYMRSNDRHFFSMDEAIKFLEEKTEELRLTKDLSDMYNDHMRK